METAENAIARRFYETVDSGRLEQLDELCATDFRGHAGAGATLAELKSSIGSFLEPFPDMRAEIRHLVQEGELVSAWLSYTATHQGEFAGVPGSGRQIRFAAWDLMRIRDGRVIELTQYCDLFAILSQIGALPTAAPA